MMVKFVCVVLFAAMVGNASALSDEKKAHIQSKLLQLAGECLKEHPLTEDDIKAFKNKDLPEADNAGCFANCIFKKMGVMDDKGTLAHADALEKAKTLFKDGEELKNIEEFLNSCIKVNEAEVSDGEKGCDRAKLLFVCLKENADKLGFSISS